MSLPLWKKNHNRILLGRCIFSFFLLYIAFAFIGQDLLWFRLEGPDTYVTRVFFCVASFVFVVIYFIESES